MKQYRGYYIDHIYFNSKNEIDAFIRERSIRSYKKSVEMFCREASVELSAIMADKADILVRECGLTWYEIEAIEIEVMEAC